MSSPSRSSRRIKTVGSPVCLEVPGRWLDVALPIFGLGSGLDSGSSAMAAFRVDASKSRDHLCHRGRPLFGLPDDHLFVSGFERRRHVGTDDAKCGWFALYQFPFNDFFWKRLAARKEVEERAAQTVDVGTMVDLTRKPRPFGAM